MNKILISGLLGLLFVSLASFTLHKFYVSIYQVHYAEEKKMLEITSRIFIDDLNNALEHNYKKKTHIGESTETAEDIEMLKQYLAQHFSIAVNGQKKSMRYLSREMEGNVVICYFSIRDIPKITNIGIENTALMEISPDQQNIIQTTIYGRKQSLLLREEEDKGLLKF